MFWAIYATQSRKIVVTKLGEMMRPRWAPHFQIPSSLEFSRELKATAMAFDQLACHYEAIYKELMELTDFIETNFTTPLQHTCTDETDFLCLACKTNFLFNQLSAQADYIIELYGPQLNKLCWYYWTKVEKAQNALRSVNDMMKLCAHAAVLRRAQSRYDLALQLRKRMNGNTREDQSATQSHI